jgi:thiamine pyrophosphokinase
MSSHHIVREKQEPALLIMQLDNFSHEHLGQLLEWSPVVIVNHDVYEVADSLGIKIDAVLTGIGDLTVQSNTRVIAAGDNPLEDAMKFLIAEAYPAVNVVANEFAIKDYILFADYIDLVIYTDNKKIYPVKSGFSKWKPGGEKIEILQEVKGLQVDNLHHVSPCILTTEKDGFYSLVFEQPIIFIAEDF